jgi:hypothetical protein
MKAWLRDALPPMTEDFHNRLVTTLETSYEMSRGKLGGMTGE